MIKIKIMNDLVQCTRCKKEKDPDMFISLKTGKQCKKCLGCREICEKSRQKCKCPHGKQKSRCKDGCGGSDICKHGKLKHYCKKGCGGGSICKHGLGKSYCRKGCGGSVYCEHNKERRRCPTCDPKGHLCSIVRCRVRSALKSNKSKGSLEYLGCDIEFYRNHIEKQFSEGMTWENQGEWEIDHIIPLTYGNPTFEESAERLHYANTQPLWKVDNMKKGNRWIG